MIGWSIVKHADESCLYALKIAWIFWNINQESLLIWKYTSDAIHHCIRMWPGHNVAEGIPFFLEAYLPGKIPTNF